MAMVAALAKKHTKVDWGASLAFVPLAVITYGLVQLDTEDRSALDRTAVPDVWVERAATLPCASVKNLITLQKALGRKGYVSVTAADEFCAVELAREMNAAATEASAKLKADATETAGFAALRNRLATQDYEPTTQEVLPQLMDHAKDWLSAGAGVVSFAAEKAVWVGKGMGLAADVMRGLRKAPGSKQ